jgi:hypothetical protein
MRPVARPVERLGIALEPEADYERRRDGSGGCEDPRITFVEPLRRRSTHPDPAWLADHLPWPATTVSKSFCPRPLVPSPRISLEAAVDNIRTL